MKKTLHALTIAAGAGIIGLASPAQAQEAEVVPAVAPGEGDAEIRINLSGKLRMLSQRIAAASCQAATGTDADQANQVLASAVTEFDTILDALENGNPDLGISLAEDYARTIRSIENVRSVWEPIRAAATNGDAQTVFDSNLALLTAAQELATLVASDYSVHLDVVEADAFLIEMAGRQRMLLVRISKNACMVAGGFGDEAIAEDLATTAATFEATLLALRDGMPAAGIRRPPNQIIADQLGLVYDRWTGIKPMVESILAGDETSADMLVVLASQLDTALGEMDSAVTMYAAATTQTSKQGE